MKRLFPVAALVALASIPALAQDAGAPAAQPKAPAAASDKMAAPVTTEDISAKRLINESVKNAANEKIGDINDVLISSDGKVAAVIVGVGGFLGIGEKDVALPFDQLTFAKDANDALSVRTSLTKEGLEQAPEYVKPKSRT